jgi:hypothetical protein
MSGSVAPDYLREIASLPKVGLPGISINDNDYGANNASNPVPSFYRESVESQRSFAEVVLASAKQAAELISAERTPEQGGNIMADNPTRDEIQDKIAASEARTEARVARLEGRIDTLVATIGGRIDVLGSKIDALGDKASAAQADSRETRSEISESRRWVIGAIIVVGVALAGLIVAMATYGDAMFGRGMNVRDLVQTTIKELQQLQAPSERK